ncbi:unnamed protein product [Litomosoides sigmodontis]|uniref:Uncharacterized protein n=1 Tax=Litomosoides sigmodontis TaxID=42156 RepID=A0A3P6U1B5_LITSI|nr:unnamed protein product [Litomosoides sigmodontis]
MYRPLGARQKDISTRLIKPTRPDIRIGDVLHLVRNWRSSWDLEGNIAVYDGGIAQYLLVDDRSHDIFFASLILEKRSLRCRLVRNEPRDILEETNNTFILIDDYGTPNEDRKKIDRLKIILSRKGYMFTDDEYYE